MVVCLYATIIIINLFFAYFKKNIKWIQVVSIIGIAILMCGYRRPFYGDLNNYEYMFDGSMSTTIGLSFIFKLCQIIGLDFWQTHYLLIILSLLTALFVINKFSLSPHLAIAQFTGYYIIISSDQIKNHAALVFLLLSIVAIYEKKMGWAIVLIVIASSIHYSFIAYILILFVVREDKKNLANTIIIVTTIITILEILGIGDVLLLLVSRLGGIVEKYLGAYGLYKLQNYTENRTHYGYLLLFGFQIMDYYLVRIGTNWMEETGCCDDRIIGVNKFILRINLVGFMLFPLFVFNQQWYRLIRDILILNYCAIGNAYYYLRINTSRRVLLFLLSILNVAVWLIGDLCIKTEPQSVLIPFFANNEFLQ